MYAHTNETVDGQDYSTICSIRFMTCSACANRSEHVVTLCSEDRVPAIWVKANISYNRFLTKDRTKAMALDVTKQLETINIVGLCRPICTDSQIIAEVKRKSVSHGAQDIYHGERGCVQTTLTTEKTKQET